ncbi:DNA-directed RNA polymerases I and III subunit RPAC2 [Cytospora mali]|uniref:DNA-directed RNA polymerases I and III subunit RPAC2 n=1 Tax=Cytospora mali TaxID=578113 RepID=A0A194VLW8_CYTMA|nr:DNA-directed RNA polymerases I and III subunit RPAC2 [Valsa mali]
MSNENGDDAVMEDVQSSQNPEQATDEIELEGTQLFLLPGSTPTAASFEFRDEGHTLGNALRYIIMKNPEVEFCAYAIPHPSEAKMNMRIQTYDGTTAIDALKKGLKDLQDLCDVVAEKFWDARESVTQTPAPSKKQLKENGEPRMYD